MHKLFGITFSPTISALTDAFQCTLLPSSERTTSPTVLSATLRVNSWTDLHEIFMEGVGWPWDDLITFYVNSGKPHDAAMVTWQTTSRGIKRSRWPLYLWSLIFQKACETDGCFKFTTYSIGQHILRNLWSCDRWCHLSQMVTVQGNPRSAHTSSPTGLSYSVSQCACTVMSRMCSSGLSYSVWQCVLNVLFFL